MPSTSDQTNEPLRIEIDRNECVGSGRCCELAPEVFKLDVDDLATVADPNGDQPDMIVYAAQRCPTRAIAVFKDGKKIV